MNFPSATLQDEDRRLLFMIGLHGIPTGFSHNLVCTLHHNQAVYSQLKRAASKIHINNFITVITKHTAALILGHVIFAKEQS